MDTAECYHASCGPQFSDATLRNRACYFEFDCTTDTCERAKVLLKFDPNYVLFHRGFLNV